MLDAFREGGWPMYVVIFFGAALLAAAYRYSSDGKKELLGVVMGLGAATLFAGLFGTVTGFIVSVEHIRELPADERWIVLIGLKESLNNLTLSLIFAFAASLLLTRGFWRRAKLTPAYNA